MKTISVGEIMKHDLISCKPSDTVETVWNLMHDHGIGLLPVIDGDMVFGTIGYIELHQSQGKSKEPVSSLMKEIDISIPYSANLYDALQVMEEEKTNILIVKGENSKVLGFVTANMIIRNYLQKKRLS
jgi:predicted transcriptional regulator